MLVVCAVTLTTGAYPVSIPNVIRALVGGGSSANAFIVDTLRLPRLLGAILIGASLGMSGGVFQSLSRNPLGSPDIIGFTSGAAAGAVAEIVLVHGGQVAIAAGAVAGGLGTAALVYVAAFRRGHSPGYRLILVGIGLSAMLTSVSAYLLTRASLYDAEDANTWLLGSLNSQGWNTVVPLAVALAVLVPVTLWAGRNLAVLEMGDDTALALGVPVERTRLVLIIAGTGLAAATVAAAGPVVFVALAAPQLARRLTRASGPQLVSGAFMGALLLVASDYLAQQIVPSVELPVGVITGAVGGVYLCWLLAHEWRGGHS